MYSYVYYTPSAITILLYAAGPGLVLGVDIFFALFITD
jgi:hypothetical protein